MNLLRFFQNMTDKMILSHKKDSDKMILILSVSAYWDGKVSDEEVDTAFKIITKHFRDMGVSYEEIKYIKAVFQDKIREFRTNNNSFYQARKELFQDLKNLESDEEREFYLKIAKKILVSDGLVEKEKILLEKLDI